MSRAIFPRPKTRRRWTNWSPTFVLRCANPSLKSTGWARTPKTQARAKASTASIPKIGYRPNLETYEGLEVVAGDPIANRMAAAKWGLADNVAKLGQPIDPHRMVHACPRP